MKIRIKGNSVRFRLTRSEVSALGTGSIVQEQTNFSSGTFVYQIQSAPIEATFIDFDGVNLIVRVPQFMIDELVRTDKVGFSAVSGSVTALIEKDFTCLDNVDEDQSDNFPNPLIKKI